MVSQASPSGHKPALVMLHGFGLDARMWRRQVHAFAGEYRVVTVDLPGFGPQAPVAGNACPAVEIARAMDASGLLRAHLVAHSFGAAAAIDFALRFPRRVQSLALVGPLLLGRRNGIESWSRCVSFASRGEIATALEMWLDDPLFRGLRKDERLFEELREMVVDYSGAHWVGSFSTTWSEPDPAPRLKDIDVPTLVVSGEDDVPSFLQMAETYARAMPRARQELVRGSGHVPNMECAEAFDELLRAFLRTV